MTIESLRTRDILKSLNYNVKVTFAFVIFGCLGNAIWGNAFGMYIYYFAGEAEGFFGLSQTAVLGITSAVRGLTMLIFLFPAGYLADKFRRDIILKITAVIGFIAISLIAFGNSFVTIFVSLILLGLYSSLLVPAYEAIFADSIPSGYRSKIYSWRYLLNQTGNSVGPFLAAIFYIFFGNNWSLTTIKSVIYVGLAIYGIAVLILIFYKDNRVMGEESEEIAEEVTEVSEEHKSRLTLNIDSKKMIKLIPILLVCFNLIIAAGGGLLGYFSVFFAEIYLIKPVWLNVLLGSTAIATGLFNLVFQKMSLKLGRAQTIFITHFSATALLLVIVIYPPLGVLLPFYIFRGSLMNGNTPLSRAILMDVIPKKNRGKWNSINLIAPWMFNNLSAILGGFLIGENKRFYLNFIIAAFIYTIAAIPIIIIMPFIGKEREAKLKMIKKKSESSTETPS
jgi:MFS family permease